MWWLAAILFVEIVEWLAPFPDDMSWQVALIARYLTVALLSQAWLWSAKGEPLILRSAIALFCVYSWVALVSHIVWHISGTKIDIMLPVFIGCLTYMVFILKRQYSIKGDSINRNTVNILLLRPHSFPDLVRSLVGYPVSSICVVADGFTWAFRRRSGIFEKSVFSESLLHNHIAIDSGIVCSPPIIKELSNVIGVKRFPFCKCVFSLRKVLNLMGGVYAIRSWFDYVPGIYASKILEGRHGS